MDRESRGRRTRSALSRCARGLSFAAAAASILLSSSAHVAHAASERDAEAAARQSALDRARQRAGLAGARTSILVTRARDGAVLYSHDADVPLIPASNMKILTAMAALDRFGPSHRFETRLHAPAPPDADGRVSELVVIGGGDPVTNSEDWWRVASALRAKGLRRIEGDVVVDDSAFDAVRAHPDWGRVSARAYHAPITALTANYGAYFVSVTAGSSPGDPVQVDVDPPLDFFHVVNGARTGPRGIRPSLVVDRGKGGAGETVRVSGRIGAGAEPDLFPRSASDSTLYAGAVLKMQLEAVGIEVGGRVRRGRRAEAPHELLVFEGRALSEIVQLFMKYSNNAIAESLVKSMGRQATGNPGSWPSGLAAMEQSLDGLGVLGPGTTLVDGSGLSTRNRVSARTLHRALETSRSSFAFGPELLASLPLAQADGTLEKRAAGLRGRVRAKTGLLSDARVTSLSGYAEVADGELVLFAVIVNGYGKGARAAMDGVDAFIAELLRHGGRTWDASGPKGVGQTSPGGTHWLGAAPERAQDLDEAAAAGLLPAS